MKEKILNIIWLCLPVLMAVLIIIAYNNGKETISIWDLFIWVLLVLWLQILIISKEKVIKNLKDTILAYEQLTASYLKLTSEQENSIKYYRDTINKHLTDGSKEIWNLIIQSFDKHGSETDYTIDSFVSESLARDKYQEHLEEDTANPDHNVEETPGVLEYWYTTESGEMRRVKVVKSYVFDSAD